jgi:hypothetical protein
MTDAELVELAIKMRKAQNEFFAARKANRAPELIARLLSQSKLLERQFDNAAKARTQGTFAI